ncbi:MAG: hypothetical protein ACERKV_05845 [Clostridiaceae bacterium]
MDKISLMQLLEENRLNNVEEINYKDDIVIFRFTYEYDEDEKKAAKAYTEDECDSTDEDVIREEFYIPYLMDIAVDNVGDIIEEAMDEFELQGQFISFDIDEDLNGNEFIAMFYSKDEDYEIDEVLDNLNI